MQPDKPATVIPEVIQIPYAETGSFSRIVTDYLSQKHQLKSFYRYAPDLEGIKQAIADRKNAGYDRQLLVEELRNQYAGLAVSKKLESNLEKLLQPTTFTITTAHQPNILSGPLYFIYKIFHAIKLADSLKEQVPGHDFVPVFFMGSEDADLDELGNVTVEGKRYSWQTKQSGAVGRMKVDKAFISLLSELSAQLEVLPNGGEILDMFRKCYREGNTIQQSTLELVNHLFGEYGLVVFIPDNAALKKAFVPVLRRELETQFSHKAVATVAPQLAEQYKVQVEGRELNLFYLLDDKRERIELKDSVYRVAQLQLEFNKEEILHELELHPERFSPNVILRGLFQEQLLPNIAFIGGGAEIAYWLELKQVFEEAGIPYPVLLLRNSILLLPANQHELLRELGFDIKDFFQSSEKLVDLVTKRESANQLSLSEEMGELNSFYQQLHETTFKIDPTLAEHVNMLQAKAAKRLVELEKKMLRAEKRKFETERRKIQKLKQLAFPGGGLQERVENISGFYARYGKAVMEKIYRYSPALEQEFTIIIL